MSINIRLELGSGVKIPSKYRDEWWFSKIKEFYHRVHPDFQDNNQKIVVDYFEELRDGSLLIPRYADINKICGSEVPIIATYKDKRCFGAPISIWPKIVPRNDIQKEAVHEITTRDNGLFVLEPGEGKTVIAIAGICYYKVKALILTHKTSLKKQWRDRFLQFSSLKESEIGLVTSSNYKDTFSCPVCIITNQTFVSLLKRDSKFLWWLNRANFGICVSDECHTTVGAPTFSKCSIYIPTLRFYGLSATPSRMFDSDVILDHVGEEIIFEKSDDTLVGLVYMVGLNYDIYAKHYKYLQWNGKFQRSRYLNFLLKCFSLNRLLLKTTKKVANRNIIIVSERLNHLEFLKERIEKTITKNVGMFVGGSSEEELKKQVTLSTPGKIRDGIDAPWKDTVILTSPIGNIKQMVGRIVRSFPNKKIPIVVDIVDISCRPIKQTYKKRVKFYLENKWPVHYRLVDNNNKIIKVDQSQFEKGATK